MKTFFDKYLQDQDVKIELVPKRNLLKILPSNMAERSMTMLNLVALRCDRHLAHHRSH